MNHQTDPATVMILDDTPANLLLLEDILTESGCRVAAFPAGDLALAAARQSAPDLLLLDIMMPTMDGFEVCRRFKADPVLKAVPIIFISALNQLADKVAAFAAGGVDYVTKPFYPEEVLARVATQLNLLSQRRELERQRQELAQAHALLKDLEAQRDTMVHMMAHDMKSPLTAIMLTISILQQKMQLLAQGAPPDTLLPTVERLLQGIETGAQRLRDMVIAFTDVSRLETAAMPLTLTNLDLRELVGRVIETLGPRLTKSNFTYAAPANPVMACGDAELVVRIMQNLLDNALNHAGREAQVKLCLETLNQGVQLRVSDNGRGIPAHALRRIFEKFSQADISGEGRRHGSGLGLTFCKLAVESQHGEIGVDSREGEGSTFWFTLPPASAD
jgi:two-component system sensor histidine kinase/response regulator